MGMMVKKRQFFVAVVVELEEPFPLINVQIATTQLPLDIICEGLLTYLT